MPLASRLLGFVLLAFAAVGAANEHERILEQLRAGGHVVLMRHAETTPGVGDPDGFRLADCATQRNLSDAGRAQARRLGAALAKHGIPIGEVRTSAWCRAAETARLAFGRAEVWSELNSTFHDRASKAGQTEAVRRRIASFRGPGNLFLVGHGSNILALTGVHPGMGGMVVVAPGGPEGFSLVGRLEPEAVLSGQTGTR